MSSQEELQAWKQTTSLRDRFRQWMGKDVPIQEIDIMEAPFSGTRAQLERIVAKTFADQPMDYHIETTENGQLAVFIHAEEEAKPARLERWKFWRWWKKK